MAKTACKSQSSLYKCYTNVLCLLENWKLRQQISASCYGKQKQTNEQEA